MKIIATTLFCICFLQVSWAQSSLSFYSGWTASTVYTTNAPFSKVSDHHLDIQMMHSPYFGGLEYEYDYKKLRLSTGLSFMLMGAQQQPYLWSTLHPVYYWAVPVLAGYHIGLPNNFGLTLEGGLDLGYQQWTNPFMPKPEHSFNLNTVIGIEGSWKRLRLGVRGRLGLTTFQEYEGNTYKHVALTTYLGYTLWDQAKSKARRLKQPVLR